MLLEGRVQVSREYLIEKYAPGRSLKDLEKKPSFEVHKSRTKIDKINGGVTKAPAGSARRSHFMARDPKTGLEVEIRYAQSHRPSQVGNSLMDVYEPRYVQFFGLKNEFRNDLDLAVYYLLHPSNSGSPFKSTAKPSLEFIDTKQRAKDKNANIDSVTDALEHAKNLEDSQLIILAKGLGLKGIERMELPEVRAEVKEYAYKFPKLYNDKAFTQVTYVEGKILHLIDKGVFKLGNIAGIRRWTWASGDREGEVIIDIHNVTQDAKVALKNHIFNNMQEGNWLHMLDSTASTISSKENAERYLKSLEEAPKVSHVSYAEEVVPIAPLVGEALPDHLKNIDTLGNTSGGGKPAWPTDFKSSMTYLEYFKKEGRPSNVVGSSFLKAITAGEVTEENAREFIKEQYEF